MNSVLTRDCPRRERRGLRARHFFLAPSRQAAKPQSPTQGALTSQPAKALGTPCSAVASEARHRLGSAPSGYKARVVLQGEADEEFAPLSCLRRRRGAVGCQRPPALPCGLPSGRLSRSARIPPHYKVRAPPRTFALPNPIISAKTHTHALPAPRSFNDSVAHKGPHKHSTSVCEPLGDSAHHAR